MIERLLMKHILVSVRINSWQLQRLMIYRRFIISLYLRHHKWNIQIDTSITANGPNFLSLSFAVAPLNYNKMLIWKQCGNVLLKIITLKIILKVHSILDKGTLDLIFFLKCVKFKPSQHTLEQFESELWLCNIYFSSGHNAIWKKCINHLLKVNIHTKSNVKRNWMDRWRLIDAVYLRCYSNIQIWVNSWTVVLSV